MEERDDSASSTPRGSASAGPSHLRTVGSDVGALATAVARVGLRRLPLFPCEIMRFQRSRHRIESSIRAWSPLT